MHLRSPLAAEKDVRQHQVVHGDDGILLHIVANAGADTAALRQRMTSALRDELAAGGADPPPLHVELVDAIERDPQQMSKLKLVRSELSADR